MLGDKARFLRILGDETKLRIIQQLLDGETCACELVPATKRAQSTVSTHLGALEKSGALESRKNGRNIYYKIKDKRILLLCEILGIKKTGRVKEVC